MQSDRPISIVGALAFAERGVYSSDPSQSRIAQFVPEHTPELFAKIDADLKKL